MALATAYTGIAIRFVSSQHRGIVTVDAWTHSLSIPPSLRSLLPLCVVVFPLQFRSGFIYRRWWRYSCGAPLEDRRLIVARHRAHRARCVWSCGLVESRYRRALYAVNRGHPVINYCVDRQAYLPRPCHDGPFRSPLNFNPFPSAKRFSSLVSAHVSAQPARTDHLNSIPFRARIKLIF